MTTIQDLFDTMNKDINEFYSNAEEFKKAQKIKEALKIYHMNSKQFADYYNEKHNGKNNI